jgi:hypothetical protein
VLAYLFGMKLGALCRPRDVALCCCSEACGYLYDMGTWEKLREHQFGASLTFAYEEKNAGTDLRT